MRYNGAALGAILLAALIAIALATSFYVTPLVISDTDPATYIIIPMLMLPLFALFFAKEPIRPEVKGPDIAIGVLLFVFLFLLASYLRSALSYLFLVYRVDLLLFPLLIAAFIVLIFGLRNLRRFAPLLIYALFASPLLLLPIINSNASFAALNTQIVYGILSAPIRNLTYAPPITLIANGYRIGIGESCVGIGILIATVMLLIPVAYLYEGKLRSKALWVVFGAFLLFMLNVLRMTLIAGLWILDGPTAALSTIHVFAGILLFYLAIVVAILVSSKFGLRLVPKRRKEAKASYSSLGIVIAVVLAITYLILTIL